MTARASDSLYRVLYDEAEKARWRMNDIAWGSIEDDKVAPSLLHVVREVALSELTTFSATQRFMSAFADDVEFTNWVAVWFYEETKHPQALIRWLEHFGVTFDDAALLTGRGTYPFMESRMGTLTMNIISEMLASASYLGLGFTYEPVLKTIARRLAADEARHASSFYSFAAQMLARSPQPDRERADALKVLYVWLLNFKQTQHPIAVLYNTLVGKEQIAGAEPTRFFDMTVLRQRVIAMIANLVGCEMTTQSDVMHAWKTISRRVTSRELDRESDHVISGPPDA